MVLVASRSRVERQNFSSIGAFLRSIDPVIVVQIYLFLLVLVPSAYIVKPLGGSGTPATMFGAVMLLLWLIGRFTDFHARQLYTPTHWIIGAYVGAMLLAFAAGMLRPISSTEVLSSLRGLISLASGAGVVLFTTDALSSRRSLDATVKSIVVGGFVLAAMGILQFFFRVNWLALMHWPGLSFNGTWSLDSRSGFTRVNATAVHSIEFSTVLGMILPLAIHLASNAARRRWWYWLQCITILTVLPMAVSRSGGISIVIGLFALGCLLTKRQLRLALVALPVALVAFRILVPGLLGTIRALFTGAGTDISVAGRTSDYQAIAAYFAQSPWVGRGFGTFMPGLYRTLDNQYAGTLIESGLIGLAATIVLLLGSSLAAFVASFAPRERSLRTLGRAVSISLLCAALLAYTFDMFGFSMAYGTMCLCVGLAGGVWRLRFRDGSAAPVAVRQGRPAFSLRRSAKVIVACVAVCALACGAWAVHSAKGTFQMQEALLIRAPDGSQQLVDPTDIHGAADLVVYAMESEESRAALAEEGVHYYAITKAGGSLEPYSDVTGNGNVVWIAAQAGTQDEAREDLELTADHLDVVLAQLQSTPGIPATLKLYADRSYVQPTLSYVGVDAKFALAGFAGLAGLIALVVSGAMLAGRSSALVTRRSRRAAESAASTRRLRPSSSR